MKYVSTIFLRAVIIAIGVVVGLFAAFLLPRAINGATEDYSLGLSLPMAIGVYAALLPFYFTLVQGFLLLGLIDKNQTFTTAAVSAFGRIKYAAIAVSLLFSASLPLFYAVADSEDAPGVMVIGLIITGIPFAIGVFAALLQQVFKSAVDIKKENNLTV